MDDEARCRQCGDCCRIKFVLESGKKILGDLFCPGLDIETKKCMIYSTRLNNAYHVACSTVAQQIADGLLPHDCAYAPHGYRGLTISIKHWAVARARPGYEDLQRRLNIIREVIRKQEAKKKGAPDGDGRSEEASGQVASGGQRDGVDRSTLGNG